MFRAPTSSHVTRLTNRCVFTNGTTPTQFFCNVDVDDLIRDLPREATQRGINVGFQEAVSILSLRLVFVNRHCESLDRYDWPKRRDHTRRH
jgi:hypothetical protein